jgi:hypothetical protein
MFPLKSKFLARWFFGLIIFLIALRFWINWGLPTPQCLLRQWTGIPCPACGGTRCLLACSHFQFLKAFYYNPLVFLLSAGICVCFLISLAGNYFNKNWMKVFLEKLSSKACRISFGALILLNWIYLYFSLKNH